MIRRECIRQLASDTPKIISASDLWVYLAGRGHGVRPVRPVSVDERGVGSGPPRGVVVQDHRQPRPHRPTRLVDHLSVEFGVLGLPSIARVSCLAAEDQLELVAVHLGRGGPAPPTYGPVATRTEWASPPPKTSQVSSWTDKTIARRRRTLIGSRPVRVVMQLILLARPSSPCEFLESGAYR